MIIFVLFIFIFILSWHSYVLGYKSTWSLTGGFKNLIYPESYLLVLHYVSYKLNHSLH